MRRNAILILLALAFLLSACSGGRSEAADVVEGYYRNMVGKYDERFVAATCAEWEEFALLEYDSFGGVTTELEDFSCRETGTEGEFTLVQCDGKIVASYGNELMDFPLADRVHKVRNEGGDWRVCGY